MVKNNIFQKIDDYRWKIPKSFKEGMLTDVIIYTDEKMLQDVIADKAYLQCVNVACLPGIVGSSLGMPDIHLGYGFPIGGVAAFDPKNGGIVSPGGVGYDINCGVRVLRTNLVYKDISSKIKDLTNALAREVPAGVGSAGSISLSEKDLDKLLVEGAKWCVKNGYGDQDDIEHTEEGGALAGADPSMVSGHAKKRGMSQQGSLGSGNHFLEIQEVQEIFDNDSANKFGLFKGQITIMIHSGSRGLGHQVCTDYIGLMKKAALKYGINVPDRQLACAPINSPEGKDYFSAMAAAANFAWANRQMLMYRTKEAFSKVLGASPGALGMQLVYDVTHNIAKFEEHRVKGQGSRRLCVHRKGATRAFPNQPVLIPGDMGRYSYVMVGTQKAVDETFGSVCHGAGRRMSRHSALKNIKATELLKELESKGIVVAAASKRGLVEEAPQAYKDVADVVKVVNNSGLAKTVTKMRPLGVIKG